MRKRTVSFGFIQMAIIAVGLVVLLPACGWLKPAGDPSKDKVYKDEEVGTFRARRFTTQKRAHIAPCMR
ncbi:MAG: hypothetical protein IPM82_13310 [Saprospiraceae bacterium]|nr:hypothetical protein [Saprospiraceae bacterium]